MQNFSSLLFILFCTFLTAPVLGQVSADNTLGWTGMEGDTATARKYYALAKHMIDDGKYDDAFRFADTAEILFVNIFSAESKEAANALHLKGACRYHSDLYDDAIMLYKKSLEIRLKVSGPLHNKTGDLYYDIANACKAKGDYKKSIEFFEKSLAIYIDLFGPDHEDISDVYMKMSNSYAALEEFQEAIAFARNAMKVELNLFGKETPATGTIFNDLGVIYGNLGEYEEAFEYYEKALAIRLELLDKTDPDIGATCNNIGVLHQSIGNFDDAIYYYQKACDMFSTAFGSENQYTANCLNNLGNSFSSKGDYGKAIQYYEKSININIGIFGFYHPDIADNYENIGIAYYSMEEYDKALLQFQKALDIRIKVFGEDHSSVGRSLNALGVIYESRGDYDKSIDFLEKSLKIIIQSLGKEHLEVANDYLNLGTAYKSKGDYSYALENYQRSLSIYEKIFGNYHPYISANHYNMGEIYELQGNFEKSIDCFTKALNACYYKKHAFQKISSFEYATAALKSITHIYLRQYRNTNQSSYLIDSHDYALQALAVVDYQNSTFSTDGAKAFWQTKNYGVCETAIAATLEKAKMEADERLRERAFTYAEKSKASLLQAQIKAADAIAFSGIPDSLLQREHDLRTDLNWREKQRQTLLDKGLAETDTNVLRISSIIFDLNRTREALKLRFETDYPAYYRLKYNLSSVSLRCVQDTLLQSGDQALLEYFVGDSSIYLFVVRTDTLIVREVKRDFPLDDWIEQLRRGLYGYYTTDKGKRTTALYASTLNQYLGYASKLYEKLFAPVQQWLPEKVIVVPDGPLGYVPFDALLTGAPGDVNDFKSYPYLMNRHLFSYTYSATLLKDMRDKKHRREPSNEFVAFAPFYNGDTTLLAGMYTYDDLMRKDLQPLAYSGQEVAAASKLMHGEMVAGAAATEERFAATAANYRILHLATHGRADNRVGDYAFLAFTEIKDSIENELLYVKDLYNLELNADLVVLSACETGIGKLQRGEGIISLARAFAYAGAKSMVTTLWSVNDKSTSELMRYFYRELQRGKYKDEALRLARKRYFDETKTAERLHPFFWAASVPVGDMRPVSGKN